MIVLHGLPLLASLGAVAVGVVKRRPWYAAVGAVVFDVGYVAVLIDENNGANTPWHLVWLVGMAMVSLGLAVQPAPGSWWADRYGSVNKSLGLWAASPVVGLVLVFVLVPWLFLPLLFLLLAAAAVVGPMVGAVMGWGNASPMWRSYAVMSGASGVVLASVVAAYVAGAFVFGF
ncbi:MAG TPA: hypothetical protein VIY70_01825 [Acidimicrobiia bacterium]